MSYSPCAQILDPALERIAPILHRQKEPSDNQCDQHPRADEPFPHRSGRLPCARVAHEESTVELSCRVAQLNTRRPGIRSYYCLPPLTAVGIVGPEQLILHRDTMAPGLLNDTAARDYSRKLQLFNAFAEPEIRAAALALIPKRGVRILDAGCGSGEALRWFSDHVGSAGVVVGIDLAAAHVAAARRVASAQTLVLQADLLQAPLAAASFDLIWSVNTINHLRDPVAGVRSLATLLRAGGRFALGQSSLLPDMYFAWDARLERLTNEAVRQYYRDKYRLTESELAATRSIMGVLRAAQLRNVTVRTHIIERVAPLSRAAEAYLLETIFRDTWGERLRPYLSHEDYAALTRLCDSSHAEFALRRPDFHFLQTFTLTIAER